MSNQHKRERIVNVVDPFGATNLQYIIEIVPTIHTKDRIRKYSRDFFSARQRASPKREDDFSNITKDTIKTIRSQSQSVRSEDILKV